MFRYLVCCFAAMSALTMACVRKNDAGVRIYGGDPVTGGRIEKSVVALRSDNHVYCTGTIIADDTILTAAHCIPGEFPSDRVGPLLLALQGKLHAVFGRDGTRADAPSRKIMRWVASSKWSSTWSSPVLYDPAISQEQRAQLVRQFYAARGQEDIGLVFFEGGIPEGFEKAEIAAQTVEVGTKVFQAGYGVSEFGRSDFGVLLATSETVQEVDAANKEFVVEGQRGQGVCQGDSGGPAFVVDGNRLVVFGVVSRVSVIGNCKASDGIYTDATQFRDWIAAAKEIAFAKPTVQPRVDPDHDLSKVLSREQQRSCSGVGAVSAFALQEKAKQVCRELDAHLRSQCRLDCIRLLRNDRFDLTPTAGTNLEVKEQSTVNVVTVGPVVLQSDVKTPMVGTTLESCSLATATKLKLHLLKDTSVFLDGSPSTDIVVLLNDVTSCSEAFRAGKLVVLQGGNLRAEAN